MSEIFNLNAVARPDLQIKRDDTNGKERIWRIPPPDSETVVNLMAIFGRLEEAAEDEARGEEVSTLFQEAREYFEGLFAERHSEQEMELLPRLGEEEVGALFAHVVKTYTDAVEEMRDAVEGSKDQKGATPARPTKPQARGSRTTSRTSRARSTRAKSKATSSTS